MHILVINSGSSSIKFSLFAAAGDTPRSTYEGEVAAIGTGKATLRIKGPDGKDHTDKTVEADSPANAIAAILAAIRAPGFPEVTSVGYRVVHPGPKLDRHQQITPEVLNDLEKAKAFAPLHDPVAVDVIHKTMAAFPDVAHYACFDTVFHQTMPEEAKTYPIPAEYRQQGVRRYGFHGLSCESIVHQLRIAQPHTPLPRRMIIAHLGSGCSVTAIVDGRSIDTTMGLTPTGGIVMGTRPGDLDPGLLLYLFRQFPTDQAASLETMLNHHAGIVALSGLPNDMKTVRAAAASHDPRATLAIQVFTRSVRKAIGSFIALMGGVDALVFAGGIGEHDAQSRWEIGGGLEDLGISLDPEKNSRASTGDAIRNLAASQSSAAVLVVPANEDWMIAKHVTAMAAVTEFASSAAAN